MNIDSDKLLEWFRDYIRHAVTNTYAVSDHQREFLDTVFEELQDAIQSGELAAKPVQVYAKVPHGFVGPGSIRGGNMFEVYNDDGIGFNFNADGGCNYANWIGSNHLNGGNWERVEK